MINPKIGTKMETFQRLGVDIVFAIDVSKSMLAEDITPSRMDKSKQLVSEVIGSLGGDRIGIVAYAGKAFPQLPLTTDYSSAKMFLQNMNTDMLSSQGTAIDEAIRLSSTWKSYSVPSISSSFFESKLTEKSEGLSFIFKNKLSTCSFSNLIGKTPFLKQLL